MDLSSAMASFSADADSDKRKPSCEICGRVFASRQSRHKHVQRFHALATSTPYLDPVDIGAINRRICDLEATVRASNTEISLLREKRAHAINNTFAESPMNSCNVNSGTVNGGSVNWGAVNGGSVNGGCVNWGTVNGGTNFNTHLTVNMHINSGADKCGGAPASSSPTFDVHSMVPFGAEFEEFVSPEQMKVNGYSIVLLLQQTNFNPEHPEHMNFLCTPDMRSFALGSDRIWTEVDFISSVTELLKKLGQRVAAANPLEGRKYASNLGSMTMGGANAISLNLMKGVREHSPMAVKRLTQLGVVLPRELTSS